MIAPFDARRFQAGPAFFLALRHSLPELYNRQVIIAICGSHGDDTQPVPGAVASLADIGQMGVIAAASGNPGTAKSNNRTGATALWKRASSTG